MDRYKEFGGSRGGYRLIGVYGLNGVVGGVEVEYVGDLFGLVIFGILKNIGFGVVGVGEFVDYGLWNLLDGIVMKIIYNVL